MVQRRGDSPNPVHLPADLSQSYFFGEREFKQDLLSPAEEVRLARIIQGNAPEISPEAKLKARNELVEHNLRFVVGIANHYKGYCTASLTLMDIVQAGNKGLIRAAEKFDPERGVRFISYAVWWIKAEINREISAQVYEVSIPPGVRSQTNKAMRVQSRSLAEQGREISDEEATGLANLEQARSVEAALPILKPIFRTDAGVKTSVRDNSKIAGCSDMSYESSGNSLNLKKASEALSSLEPREERVLRLYSGLTTDGTMIEPLTLAQIGKALGLTRERVRQIKVKAAAKLIDGPYADFFSQLAKE